MKKLTSILLALVLAVSCTVVAFAKGGIGASDENLFIQKGDEKTFTVSADNAAGRIDVYSTNPSIATVSLSSAWLDKDTVEITVSAEAVGSCKIVVAATDVATYDEESVSGDRTVEVSVTEGEPCVNHTWDDGTVIPSSADAEEGEKLLTCTECGATMTEKSDAADEPAVMNTDADATEQNAEQDHHLGVIIGIGAVVVAAGIVVFALLKKRKDTSA